eukprot:COSAG01_NODE_34251_length_550_cov_6.747228_1_plen_136_part_10
MSGMCMSFFLLEHASPDRVKNRADMGFQITARHPPACLRPLRSPDPLRRAVPAGGGGHPLDPWRHQGRQVEQFIPRSGIPLQCMSSARVLMSIACDRPAQPASPRYQFLLYPLGYLHEGARLAPSALRGQPVPPLH